jgi:hypothetical protein
MKRFNMVAILGLTLMLLAWAPQIRADGTDHFDYDHGNTVAATSSPHHDMDWHSNAWRDADHNRHVDGDSGGWGMSMGNDDSGSDSDPGSGSSVVSTPEPSSLFLLLSGLAAAAVGLALKKVAV